MSQGKKRRNVALRSRKGRRKRAEPEAEVEETEEEGRFDPYRIALDRHVTPDIGRVVLAYALDDYKSLSRDDAVWKLCIEQPSERLFEILIEAHQWEQALDVFRARGMTRLDDHAWEEASAPFWETGAEADDVQNWTSVVHEAQSETVANQTRIVEMFDVDLSDVDVKCLWDRADLIDRFIDKLDKADLRTIAPHACEHDREDVFRRIQHMLTEDELLHSVVRQETNPYYVDYALQRATPDNTLRARLAYCAVRKDNTLVLSRVLDQISTDLITTALQVGSPQTLDVLVAEMPHGVAADAETLVRAAHYNALGLRLLCDKLRLNVADVLRYWGGTVFPDLPTFQYLCSQGMTREQAEPLVVQFDTLQACVKTFRSDVNVLFRFLPNAKGTRFLIRKGLTKARLCDWRANRRDYLAVSSLRLLIDHGLFEPVLRDGEKWHDELHRALREGDLVVARTLQGMCGYKLSDVVDCRSAMLELSPLALAVLPELFSAVEVWECLLKLSVENACSQALIRALTSPSKNPATAAALRKDPATRRTPLPAAALRKRPVTKRKREKE